MQSLLQQSREKRKDIVPAAHAQLLAASSYPFEARLLQQLSLLPPPAPLSLCAPHLLKSHSVFPHSYCDLELLPTATGQA